MITVRVIVPTSVVEMVILDLEDLGWGRPVSVTPIHATGNSYLLYDYEPVLERNHS